MNVVCVGSHGEIDPQLLLPMMAHSVRDQQRVREG